VPGTAPEGAQFDGKQHVSKMTTRYVIDILLLSICFSSCLCQGYGPYGLLISLYLWIFDYFQHGMI
jgi:hypothetical protein